MTLTRRALVILLCAVVATAGLAVVDWLLDRDRDDFWTLGSAATDCDDANPAIFPGAPETPLDGIDQDCDGRDSVRGSNVVLVTFDAVRGSNLSVYGHQRDTSPHVDRLASEGVLFRNAFSQSSWTIPSLGSLLTSLYPRQHGASKVRSGLGDKVPLLAEILRDAGYATAMFYTSAYPLAEMGFSRGFDTSVEHPGFYPKKILRWLREHADRPFFVWIHYYKPHVPYHPSPPFDGLLIPEKLKGHRELAAFWNKKECQRRLENGSEDDARIRMGLYDETLRESDDDLGRVLDDLDRLKLAEKTLLIFSSDHGEEFFEHGGCDHGQTLYDEVIHIPLVIRHPLLISSGIVEESQVRSIDIAPTILDALEITTDHQLMGRSLLPIIADETADLPVFTGFLQHGQPTVALREDGYKLIQHHRTGRLEFYDLVRDPGEQHDLAQSDHPKLSELSAQLQQWIDETAGLYSAREMEYDGETIERLRSLGYLE